MKQQDLGLELSKRRTRKMELLELMDSVLPWPELVAQLTAVAPVKATGRPPFAHETMLRLHLLQQLFGLSDFAMEEALFETPLYRDFAGLDTKARLKARIWAEVEHPFRVIKRQFGYAKVRYRGLAKNTAQLYTLFMLSNLWMVRKRCRGAWRHE